MNVGYLNQFYDTTEFPSWSKVQNFFLKKDSKQMKVFIHTKSKKNQTLFKKTPKRFSQWTITLLIYKFKVNISKKNKFK